MSFQKNILKRLKITKTIPKIHTKEPKQDGVKRIYLHKNSDTELLALAYKIPNFKHKDIPALNALSELLGSGKSSLMSEIL